MPRYFIQLAYRGTHFSGFQVQQNANSIQSEVEKAIQTIQRQQVTLTGSSRTDAGVHALQNFFHFDFGEEIHPQFVYKMNSILPDDIVVHRVIRVGPEAHSRFDAISREYEYFVYREKDPFMRDRGFYFPYRLDLEAMREAASMLLEFSDFTSFSKRNTQARTFVCKLFESEWNRRGDQMVYRVKADRFLRGMVRALVATMLQVGRGKLRLEQFRELVLAKDSSSANFAAPAQGLFLVRVNYPENYFGQ